MPSACRLDAELALPRLKQRGRKVERILPALREALGGPQLALDGRRRLERLTERARQSILEDASKLAARRGVDLLERLGGPEARTCLAELANGAADA